MNNLDAARQLVSSSLVSSLLYTHPNDLSVSVSRPYPFSESWWAWAADTTVPCRWMQLLEYYSNRDPAQHPEYDIPAEFRQLIDQVCALALPRSPISITTEVPLEISSRGMSPKKAHEVTQSVAYISNLLHSLGIDPRGVRIVDIGAGQGYLTRALQVHLGTTHLLALDSSEVQTKGAQRREERTGIVGSITQKTIHITPTTLCESIEEWIGNISSQEADPAPVLLVALHACGSLTPDILRSFFIQRTASKDRPLWTPIAMIAVGCCYNLLAPQDFPLSEHMSTSPTISLPTSAYHMAAQIPGQWFRTPESRADATLALRKVVWRAIIGARFAKTADDELAKIDGTGDRPVMRRLGRLNNTIYDDWRTFASVAGKKIGVDFGPDNELDAEETRLIGELEVLHVLRCIIGPLVESLIIMDREKWVQEQLGGWGTNDMTVEMVNLFDQATGSGRNIALVVAPRPLGDG
ncbi:methyltransferase domain-containing protein [Mycena alexandri]|uniref:Methyltransferase domain-containing protein n=1 Tax=Mycena alexandri TaxID=1745969 RepID=A0AAD6TCD3_9AGAR|nr:methyltransferase domain-containing protein [Mycena alexandri]